MPLTCGCRPNVLGDLERQLYSVRRPRGAAAKAAGERPAPVGTLGEHATDDNYLRLALRLKYFVDPPRQSQFRVVSVLSYRDGSGEERYVSGTNCESAGMIQNSICGERSALSQLRLYDWKGVITVYVVTDMCGATVSPGILCREQLSANLPSDTPVVMASGATPDGVEPALVTRSTLGELLPLSDVYTYTSVHQRLDHTQSQAWAENFAAKCQPATQALAGGALQAYAAAKEAAQRNLGNEWHPLGLGAAVVFADGTIESSGISKCVEYGNTADAIQRLQEYIERKAKQGVKATAVIQSDHRGVLLAPYATARSYLTEHGLGDILVAAHTPEGKVVVTTAIHLAPNTPAWDGLSSQ